MKTKWYLGALIIILTFLGISQEQYSVPNQEIVLQFINDEVSSDEAQDAIAIIIEQLESIGINYTQVRDEEGKLKITYYSDIDIASVKKTLSEDNTLELDYTNYNQNDSKSPIDENSNSYQLDVYEIQEGNDLESDSNKYALEFKTENDRFFTPNVYVSVELTQIKEKNKIEYIAYNTYKNSAIAIENTLRKIPEVRAGPLAIKGNS